jgi:broad specificity phosphatase PhoE
MGRKLAAAFLTAGILAVARPAEAQRAIFVVRHAEKASDSNEPGVLLSKAGQVRAQKLAAVLARAGVNAIYSTDFVRTLATAEPLARALKIPVQKYAARDAKGQPTPAPLVQKLKAEHGKDTVLVVGHADTIPSLLKTLGYPEQIDIPGDQYDNLFVVVPTGSGPPTLLRLTY